MRQMVAQRFTNQQVADGFNRLGIKTPSGKQYYAELVGATWSKLRRRDSRKSPSDLELLNMQLCISEDLMLEHEGLSARTSKKS